MTGQGRYRFLLTVDDPGGLIQDLQLFDNARRFFDEEGVPASFMTVPRGEGGFLLDRHPQWLAAVRAAERDGHECQLHGLDHKDCEFGPYPEMICALHADGAAAELQRDRERFSHNWRRELFLEKLQTAVAIYERAFQRRPLVFRTGALSQTPELYDVMAEVGFRYASNLVTDPRGWKYIVEQYDEPGDWDPAVPPGPYRLSDGIINLPIISEYAWYLTPEKIDRHLALALDDLARVRQADGVFLFVCHVQCVGAEDRLSQQLLHRLFAAAREQYDVQFQTLSQLVADIEAGDVRLHNE